MPTKMGENLEIDFLVNFETYVIPVSEEGISGEITSNIMVDIEGDIVP